jgi:iron-sulfur cluster repair protein YtfE (RIC family)
MLHAIGRKDRRNGGDLVDMLLDCHGRIRTFSGLAVAVTERIDAPRVEVVDVCARVERYFAEALPLHVRDEEESVLPRLRGRAPAIDAALDRMHEQHDMHESLVARLLEASAGLRRAPAATRARMTLQRVARPLHSLLERHLQAEEEILFPAIRALVSLEEQDVIEDELTKRRT